MEVDPKNLIPNFRTCQTMKGNGWPKETYFCFTHIGKVAPYSFFDTLEMLEGDYFAPTISEILNELPPTQKMKILPSEGMGFCGEHSLEIVVLSNGFEVGYAPAVLYERSVIAKAFKDKKLVQALANLWNWWRENYK